MAKRILAFDIGTNSTGWALIEEGERIVDCGVRIFEMGNKMDKDNEISRKGDRTLARSARRRNFRYKLRREKLTQLLDSLQMLPDPPVDNEKGTEKTSSLLIYALRHKALSEQVSLKELGRILLYLNKKRGFKSSRKEELQGNSEQGKVKGQIAELKAAITDGGFKSVGSYFYHLKEAHSRGERLDERIKGHWVGRDMYIEEFDRIWAEQSKHYPSLLTDQLKDQIRNKLIFYQRKLKSQKHLVSKCRFEPDKRVAPKSSIAFQEFRLWQKLADVRISYDDRQYDKLTLIEKQVLADVLHQKEKLSPLQIIKELGLSKSEAELNDIDDLKGVTTLIKLRKAIGNEFETYNYELIHQLWHTLFFFDNTEKLKEYAINAFGYDDETAEKYSRVSIEPEYGSISHKAISKILPYLKQGFDYTDACIEAGYHHSYIEQEDAADRPLEDKVPQLDNKDARNPVVQKSVNECISIANNLIDVYGRPDLIRIELSRELKKPKHKREEARRKNRERESLRKAHAEFLNKTGLFKGEISWRSALIDKYQLWLELGCEDEGAEEFRKFAGQIKPGSLEKYRLWLECDRISPYSGKPISLTRLFDADIEIEHIIPYSISMDNSFMNKTLSEYSINKVKGNRTPFQYFKAQGEDQWESFTQRTKHLPGPKREKMLTTDIPKDFLNSQLTNTGYIGKVLTKQMKKAFGKVEVRNGQATAQLRRMWQLNSLLHYKVADDSNEEEVNTKNMMKNRKDHRHHALDAIVIACTTNRHIQVLSSASQLDEKGRLENHEVQEPWSYFRGEVESYLDKLLVSHNNRKRLTTLSINKYRHWNKNTTKPEQKTIAARGALHEETLYGQIKHPETQLGAFVSKKDVTSIDDLNKADKIVDIELRELVKEHLKEKGKIDHEKNPLIIHKRMYGKWRPIKVRHVRVENKATRMVQLRPNENEQLFVPTGSNYCIALYEGSVNGKPKRDYLSISFLEAVKSSIAKNPLFPKAMVNEKSGETFSLCMVLKAKDMLVMYSESEEEIDWHDQEDLFNRLYYVVKWSGTDGKFTLHKHYIVEENVDRSSKPIVIRQVPNTLSGVKVQVDRLGKLKRLDV